MADALFTTEQIKADGRGRVINTGGQVSGATAIVGLGSSFLDWQGVLNGPLDPIGFGYWVILVSIATAALTNLPRLRGKA